MTALSTGASNAGPGQKAPVCWSPEQLEVRNNEWRVRRGGFAYREPPADVQLTPEMRVEQFYRRAIRRFRILNGEKVVSLTFDIGEQPHEISGYQGRIFDHLRKEGVRATVFLGGKWMLTHPERTRQFIADPLFEVANHGWEHRNLRLLKPIDQQRAIMRAQTAYAQQWQALKKRQCRVSGSEALAHKNAAPAMKLFRFPFGACRDDSLKMAGDAGLLSVQWDLSSSDPWKGQTAKRMVRAVVPRVKPGSIVLFHANGRGWHTSKAIPEIVAGLRKRGYRFVTIGDLLEMSKRGEAEPILTKTCFDSRVGDTNRYDKFSAGLHARYDRFQRATRQRIDAGVKKSKLIKKLKPVRSRKKNATTRVKPLERKALERDN